MLYTQKDDCTNEKEKKGTMNLSKDENSYPSPVISSSAYFSLVKK
jgi:hypothetical protein